jgi:OFA family oxalate/formate antiporter-like MFS transporter
LSWVLAGLATTLSGLYAAYAVGGVGVGAVYGACMGAMVKWFPDRRGLAVGLTAGSYGFGAVLTILPIQWMIAGSGYRTVFIVFGILQGLTVMVLAQNMVSPASTWRPAGWSPAAASGRVRQSAVSYRPTEMLRTSAFYAMYLVMVLAVFGGMVVTAQLSPIARTYHLDQAVAVAGVSALALAMMLNQLMNGLSRPFWGWISDRLGRYETMAIAFSLGALGILFLLQVVERPGWFVVASGLTVFAWGACFALLPAAFGDLFGPAFASTNYGIQYTAKGVASIFAGWGAARLLESTGTWEPVFWVAVAANLIAALLAGCYLRPLAVRMAAGQARTPESREAVGRMAPSSASGD